MTGFSSLTQAFSKLAAGRVRSRCAPPLKQPDQTAVRQATNICPNDSTSDRPTSAATSRVIFSPDSPTTGTEFGDGAHPGSK